MNCIRELKQPCYMTQLSSDFVGLLAKGHPESGLHLVRAYHASTNSIPQNQEVDEDQGPFWGWAVSTGDRSHVEGQEGTPTTHQA